MADWLTIGKVTGVHGLAGNLKIWSFAESPETFAPGRTLRLVTEGETTGETVTIDKARPQKKGLLLTLKEITTREAAEAQVGKELLVHREDLPEPEEDAWYWQDLYGLKVVDSQAGEIGVVDHIFPTGADDILVVKDNGREVLVPMNPHFVESVDLDNRRITTCLPEGFISA